MDPYGAARPPAVAGGAGQARAAAEGELALARAALDGGEPARAAAHLANAIAADPALPAVYQGLHHLDAATATDAVDLFPAGGAMFIGTVAARSYLCARAGRLNEALHLLASAVAHQPHKPWTAPGWLAAPGLADSLDHDAAAADLVRLALALPDPVAGDLVPALLPFLDLAGALVRAHPDDVDRLPALSALARRLGHLDEAIEWCTRTERTRPGAASAIMLAYALRAAGRVEESHRALLAASDRDPDDLDVYVDIADSLVELGRRGEAPGWLDRVLAVEPEHPKAFPTACALRFGTDGDIGHLVRLADHIRAHPDRAYPDRVLARACEQRPWLRVVPAPGEAVCSLLVQLAERYPDPVDRAQIGISCTLSAVEPPSAIAAVRAALPRMKVDVEQPAEPRQARTSLLQGPGRYRVWRLDGTATLAAVPQPSRRAVDALLVVARRYWPHPLAAYDQAVLLADVSLTDLLGLLAHVPPPPADEESWTSMARTRPDYWPRFAQAWACLGILHHRADEPWRSSTRRAVLADLATGIEDWTTDAALNAMVVAAWVDPEIRTDVADLVARRFAEAAEAHQHRQVSIMRSLASLVLVTPAMPPEVTGFARDLIAGQDSGSATGGRAA